MVIALGSVLRVLMLLKERSSQVRLERAGVILCLVRLERSRARPATELISQLDSRTLPAPSP